VVVTTESRDNFRALAHLPRFPELVVEEDGEAELLAAVERCEGRVPRAWIMRELASRPAIPGLVRAVVRRALDEADWSQGVTAPVSTITKAASLVGCSRSYLQKLASQRHINLREVLDAVRFYSAVEMRAATRLPWGTIARRLGYASGSGLSGLSQRVIGHPLTELQQTSPYDAARTVLLRFPSEDGSRPPIRGAPVHTQ